MADESEDYVVKQFTRSVQGLVESVKEMLAASRLLRGRIESNDHVLNRIETKHALLEDRLMRVEQANQLLSQRITELEKRDERRIRLDAQR